MLGAYLNPVFGRIDGTREEHSGVYECVFEANPQIRGQVNISGNFICLLLGSEEGCGEAVTSWVICWGVF